MPTKNFVSLLLLSAIFTLGCRSVPMASNEKDIQTKKFETNPEMANINIYRNEFRDRETKIDLTFDHHFIGRTLGDTFILLATPSGKKWPSKYLILLLSNNLPILKFDNHIITIQG